MDLTYITGQRPADALVMRRDDIKDDYLLVKQAKTTKKLRIPFRNIRGQLIKQISARRIGHLRPNLITGTTSQHVAPPLGQPRNQARAAAAAIEASDEYLAKRISEFVLRNSRPKAASEIADIREASALRGHSNKRITETGLSRAEWTLTLGG
ncbi:tyrosine-type recombinase/integrase [Pseudomonas pseudonitroreducens]|uniref:tyrosine-type recombinase/integrase n=1 Tax=Pseudomonas pseudonitroreducens TaxID=2892326 RepID=UPI001F17344E|nr:tyrosine-type recombinase/integrase [Pseudomonas pseudonitroreducens]